MAKSNPNDRGKSRSTGRQDQSGESTQRLPKLQRAVDAWEDSLTDWPDQVDNDAAGDQ